MEWLIVSGLVILGLALIIVEVIFVPGTTVVGIFGFVLAGYGVYEAFNYFGKTTGTIVLAVSGIIGFGVLIYALKSGAWTKLALKDEHHSRTNDDFKLALEVGQMGTLVSSAKPIGKAAFDDKEIEVRTNGQYLAENTPITISRIDSNKIYVEPTKR